MNFTRLLLYSNNELWKAVQKNQGISANCKLCDHTGFSGSLLRSHIKKKQSTSVSGRTAYRPATVSMRLPTREG